MGSKLKVSTKYIDAQKKIEKIVRILKEHPEGLSPKIISLYTRINNNTVKSILPKIPNISKKEGLRGMYVLVDNTPHGSIFDWNLHNIILTYNIADYHGEKVNEIINIGTVKFNFVIGKNTKNAHIHLSTDTPINISSLSVYCGYFIELIKNYCDTKIEIENIIIKSIEFNKDFINLRLDGLKSITLSSYLYQYKIYQKKQGLRQEHKINVPIGMSEIFSMLEGSHQIIDICSGLNHIIKKQNDSTENTRKIIGLLNAILIQGDNKNVNANRQKKYTPI